jgi:hypothetical protein
MSNHQKMKGVSFNTKNPAEKRLYDYACSIESFSGFMKHLLTNHLAAGWESKASCDSPIIKEDVKKVEEKQKQSITKGAPYNF